ncbi:CO or xanthine dehydrogenase, Mo-binding subunit [Sphingomonas palmae]|uniref:CO or xanthine dehydrogenase, Mo-binding subunit n=1 Tax=Sphingomonas palmae TaxID=1855283 RepID=A0A1H7T2W9_9SPHN|nr:xanthine dehydrogenase family protein molybdopterin-binding subunit [Sphingomonas palmae]SEL79262.1 CO or xanthine dehydrogenase, Mo-binding subunit [Sphingomonas palmae]
MSVETMNRNEGKNQPEVGRDVPRLESRRKVTGRADYVHNLSVPGMLHAKVFRSTVPHGRILSIDTSEALDAPGVHYVLTGEDIRAMFPHPYYGPAFHDQPVLALDKVRYVGEPVAVVLAEDPFAAADAVQMIVADYEELEPVYDEVEAVTSPVVVHDVLKPAGTFPDLKHLHGKRDTNVALDYQLRRGDCDAAFSAAAHVFEHEFRSQPVMHVPLEPMVSLAVPDHDRLTIHTASQSPSFVRMEIARLLGWPENRVRVMVPHLGGGFGAKLYIKLEALVACAALIARAPVKLSLTMEEQFYTITKHASTFRIKTGVDADGRITARRCEVYWNGGAYADIGPRVTQKSGFTAPGPYDIENVSIDSYALYTNRPPAGALRGFGIPQLVWAYESQADIIARELGQDPVEFRRRNLLRNGRPQATGTIMESAAIHEVLETVVERLEWAKPFDRGSGPVRRGRAIAIGFKASIAPTTSVAIVTVAADGSASLSISTVDMGQGSDTAMAQIVAETLGIPTEEVTVVHPDTDTTPYDMATLGSRSTFHTGNAVKRAAEDARERLARLAEEAGMPAQDSYAPAEVFRKRYGMQAGTVTGTGSYIPEYRSPDEDGQSPKVTPYWMIGATGVELEVDTETGHVHVTRMVNAVDCGTPLNPKIVEAQISGAAIMQFGFTMSEEMHFDAGQVTNASFADYKIPGIHDIPPLMDEYIVDAVQSGGPFGAKGVGESATFGVSPSIAGAIEDAVGVRLTELPLTPEKVLRAIRAAAGDPLED